MSSTNPQDEPPLSTSSFVEQAQKKRQIYQSAATNDKRKIEMTRDTLGGQDKMASYIEEHQEFVRENQIGNLPEPGQREER